MKRMKQKMATQTTSRLLHRQTKTPLMKRKDKRTTKNTMKQKMTTRRREDANATQEGLGRNWNVTLWHPC